MALETVNITVNAAGYTAIGSSVVALTVTEKLVGDMLVHVVAAGGAAPTIASPGQWWDKEYRYEGGTPADIYILSPNGTATVGVVRE